jgi:hypothetical protein
MTTLFTAELLRLFVEMPSDKWRALTAAMGTMYRARITKETYIVDSVRPFFPFDVPPQTEWEEVRSRINAVRHQVLLRHQIEDETNGVATDESPRARKRTYQREYMRRLRQKRRETKAAVEEN